jgi:hypothetical protein
VAQRKTKWESELWTLFSQGDGLHCPAIGSCQRKIEGTRCLNDHLDVFKIIQRDFEEVSPEQIKYLFGCWNFYSCPISGRIFSLIYRLARNKFHRIAPVDRLPVPTEQIYRFGAGIPIEVRQVPMKLNHGSVWKIDGTWIIQINSNDSPRLQRFTLYHEFFHIIAHCNCSDDPIFKKYSNNEGSFNELLADHFSGAMLLPFDWVKKVWPELKDINKMASLFEAPKVAVLIALFGTHMI